jgi:hypothetical protein
VPRCVCRGGRGDAGCNQPRPDVLIVAFCECLNDRID